MEIKLKAPKNRIHKTIDVVRGQVVKSSRCQLIGILNSQVKLLFWKSRRGRR